MPFTVAELAEEFRETNRRLTNAFDGLRGEFSDLRKEFSGLRGEFSDLRKEFSDQREEFSELRKEIAVTNNSLGWVIKIGTSLVACLLGILTFAYRVDQNAIRTEVTVVALQADLADFKKDSRARATRTEEAIVALKTDFAEMKKDLAEFKAESKARDKEFADSFDRIEKMLARPATR